MTTPVSDHQPTTERIERIRKAWAEHRELFSYDAGFWLAALDEAQQREARLREAIKADLTKLAYLTPDDWSHRRGGDPIARTINAARDIVDNRFDAALDTPEATE